ncbi:MAG: hypothetical protein ABJM37_08595, partial [Gilvibacter sp.]
LSFGVFALVDVYLVSKGGRYKPKQPVSFLWDIAVILLGLILYGVLMSFHGSFTGMPLIG